MSEDFVRCSNCGNLNIQGTTKCVFCDTEIKEDAAVVKEFVDDPSVQAPGAQPIPEAPPAVEEKSADIPAMPVIPDAVEEKKEVEICDDERIKEYSSGSKFLFLTLLFIGAGIIHYFLNVLTSIASVQIIDPDIQLFPTIPNSMDLLLNIRGSSVILGVIFAILIGYMFGRFIRMFTNDNKEIFYWMIYAIFIDLILNFGIAAVFIYGLGFVDILASWFAGAVFIFTLLGLVTLFIPIFIGSHIIYCQIDRILFRKRHAIS